MKIYLETSRRRNPLGTGRMLVRKGNTFYYKHFATGVMRSASDMTSFDFGILLLTKPIK